MAANYDKFDKELRREQPHNIILEGRERMSVSGVEDVESFDETTVVMFTSRGVLVVGGEDLHIEQLSLNGGELAISGRINSLTYEEEAAPSGGFFSRLFK